MKELIKEVRFVKEQTTQFGTLYQFAISYDEKIGYYRSKSKDQKNFIAGQEAEFTEEERQYTDKDSGEEKTFLVIKPIRAERQSNFGKKLKVEQSRYSGFATSYAKDLVIADKLKLEDLTSFATVLFEFMVELDKTLES